MGRMDDNDLVVAGEKVSRYHAVVAETANGFTVTDLRSTNGTHVNDERVVESHLLRDGDRNPPPSAAPNCCFSSIPDPSIPDPSTPDRRP